MNFEQHIRITDGLLPAAGEDHQCKRNEQQKKCP